MCVRAVCRIVRANSDISITPLSSFLLGVPKLPTISQHLMVNRIHFILSLINQTTTLLPMHDAYTPCVRLNVTLVFVGPCVIVVTEESKTNKMLLIILLYFL